MDSGTVVPKLRHAIGEEGLALLKNFKLLQPLVEQMVCHEAVAAIAISDEQLVQEQLVLIHQHGFDHIEQWQELLDRLGRSEQELLEQLRHDIRRRSFMRERFAAKAEARFLERKNELDQVVYSLLRLENSFLARELYLQIELNLQVELSRQKAVLETQQAVNHLIQFILAFQKTRLRLSGKTLPHEAAATDVMTQLLQKLLLTAPQSVQQLLPLLYVIETMLVNQDKLLLHQLFIRNGDGGYCLVAHHLFDQGLEQLEILEKSKALLTNRMSQFRNHRPGIHRLLATNQQ